MADDVADDDARELTDLERYALCIAGALAPIVISAANLDVHSTFVAMNVATIAGYVFRIVCLLLLGAMSALLYRDENSRLKLFHLGIAAPALFASLVHGGTGVATVMPPFISSAYAQSMSVHQLPVPSPGGEFLRGLFGGSPPGQYYVIVASAPDEKSAIAIADKLNAVWTRTTSDDPPWQKYRATAYAPYKTSNFWTIALGTELSQQEAETLKAKAVKSGLPKDTFIWKTREPLPSLPTQQTSPAQ